MKKLSILTLLASVAALNAADYYNPPYGYSESNQDYRYSSENPTGTNNLQQNTNPATRYDTNNPSTRYDTNDSLAPNYQYSPSNSSLNQGMPNYNNTTSPNSNMSPSTSPSGSQSTTPGSTNSSSSQGGSSHSTRHKKNYQNQQAYTDQGTRQDHKGNMTTQPLNQNQSSFNTNSSTQQQPIDQHGTNADTFATEHDKELGKKIRHAISSGWFSKGYDNVAIRVDNGNVTLSGTVETQKDRTKLQDALKDIKGIRSLNLQISTKDQTVKPSLQNAPQTNTYQR